MRNNLTNHLNYPKSFDESFFQDYKSFGEEFSMKIQTQTNGVLHGKNLVRSCEIMLRKEVSCSKYYVPSTCHVQELHVVASFVKLDSKDDFYSISLASTMSY